MAEKCGIPHPDNPEIKCWDQIPLERHQEHYAYWPPPPDPDREMVIWDNTYYKPLPPPPSKSRDRQMKQGTMDMARGVRPVQRSSNQMIEDLERPESWLRHDAHSTEKTSADISKIKNSRRRKQVLLVVRAGMPNGVTDDEVAQVLNDPDMPAPRVASRRGELEKYGWVEVMVRDGREVERPTRTGAPARVWVLTESAQSIIHLVDFSE